MYISLVNVHIYSAPLFSESGFSPSLVSFLNDAKQHYRRCEG